MPKMTVIWTALPNGLAGQQGPRRARVTAYVSMRLQSDGPTGKLSDFGGAMAWPATLASANVQFMLKAGTASSIAKVVSQPPDTSLWSALFAPTTLVTSHAPDSLGGRPVNTYSAGTVLGRLQAAHQQLSVASHVALPTRAAMRTAFPELHAAFGPLGPGVAVPVGGTALHAHLAENLFRPGGGGFHRNIASVLALSRDIAASTPDTIVRTVPDTGPASQFAALQVFHAKRPGEQTAAAPASDPAKALDFHQALAALAQYPILLRQLGLAVDLEIDLEAPGAVLPQSPLNLPTGALQIVPSFTGTPSFLNYSPKTAYILDGDRIFTAAPENPAAPDTIAGFLNLAQPDFDLIQVDVDGLGLKTINAVAGQMLSQDGAEEDATSGLPAPRSAGISVHRDKHAEALGKRFAAALSNNRDFSGDNITTLHAEDVTRGYRFDVQDETTARWRTLHARDGTYAFANRSGGPMLISDEGFSQPTAAEVPIGPPEQQAQLYVHDSLMRWLGWSLSAPRPGLSLGDQGPKAVSNEGVPGGFPLSVNFRPADHSLPRLRYGRHYRIRARTVDLAGNSLSVDEADATLQFITEALGRPAPILPSEAGKFMYRRFEPVAAPVVVAREKFTEGESLERLVIRSHDGQSADAVARRLMALVADKRPAAKVIYLATNERHVVPPKTSQFMAETFGLFDASIGAEASAARTYNVARKEKGRLTDDAIIDPATGQSVPIPTVSGIDPATGSVANRPAVELVPMPAGGTYAVHHEAQLPLPYLPDPLARGATLCGLPGVGSGQSGELDAQGQLQFAQSTLPPAALSVVGSTTRIGFPGDWPDALPFRLALAELPDGASPLPTWDAAARVLTVRLGKAEEATMRLSSFLGRDDLALSGIWAWMLERAAGQGLPPPNAGDAETAEAGCVWMITPFREIKLVHAVQQPLLQPDLEQANVVTEREPNASFAYFAATAPVDGKSTAKLDLLATWQETEDRLDPSGATTIARNAHVLEVPIHPGEVVLAPEGKLPIAIYDASHRTVAFQAPPLIELRGRFATSRHEFGDTKHRTVTYQLVATSRFREYFPPEVTDLSRAGKPATVEVPSCARPAAPKLAYAIPFYEWSRTTNAGGVQVNTRKRGGVRVYLERPWFSSGDGELLGVILPDPASYPPPDDLQPFVSHWGGDPIWLSAPAPGAPADGSYGRLFPAAVALKAFLTLDEVPVSKHTVFVAGHQVSFDLERGQWFCDIPVELGPTYSPFVRLALARYQPHSIPGMELSHVVLTDFVQLSNDRTVTLTPSSTDTSVFALTVDGPIYQLGAWSRRTIENIEGSPDFTDFQTEPAEIAGPVPVVEVHVEQRIPGGMDDAGWLPASNTNVAAASAVDAERPDGATLWKGQVSLPASRAHGQFRIVVREFERLPTDRRESGVAILSFDPPEVPRHVTERHPVTFVPGAQRLVFAETIEL